MNCQCDMHGRGSACHCRTCCLTFTGLSAFDRHLRLRPPHKDPVSVGLVQNSKGQWGRPANLSARRFFEAKRG